MNPPHIYKCQYCICCQNLFSIYENSPVAKFDFNQEGGSILLTVVQLIAARKLALSPTWIQCFTNGTTRRQSAKQNFAVTIKDAGGELLPILLSTSIIPETEESDTVANAIVIEVEKKAALMNDWKLLHEKIFPNRQHDIPAGLQLSIGKLSDYGLVTTDTCNSSQKLNRLLWKRFN